MDEHRFKASQVVIVDEANMVSGKLWLPLLQEIASSGAKLVVTQDSEQIKSRHAGDYARMFGVRFGSIATTEVIRQQIPWQRKASKSLNEYEVLDGMTPYFKRGHMSWHQGSDVTVNKLASDYVASYLQDPKVIALAFKNVDVDAINASIHSLLKEKGILQECWKVGKYEYARGDKIRFCVNDHYGNFVSNILPRKIDYLREWFGEGGGLVGVKNGSFGIIEDYSPKNQVMRVKLEDGRLVKFDLNEYPHITHGYAMTIHKSEGTTFNGSFVLSSPLMSPATTLVAMTRHRKDVRVYLNQEQFIDFKAFIDSIRVEKLKDNLADHVVVAKDLPYYSRVREYTDLISELASNRLEMEAKEFYKTPQYASYRELCKGQEIIAQQILSDWQNHKPFVRLAGIGKDILETVAGLRSRLLSDLEKVAAGQVQEYMTLVRTTRLLWQDISKTHPGSLSKTHKIYKDYRNRQLKRNELAARLFL